jgi:hypothetical protein
MIRRVLLCLRSVELLDGVTPARHTSAVSTERRR